MRVYLPLNLASLGRYVEAGAVPASVEKFTATDEREESEYAALMAAADACAADLLVGGRRVVLVAEVPRLDGPVPMSMVVAVHADTEDHPDPDADLAWFATQEIPDLLS